MLTWNVDARKAAHVVIRYVDAQGDLSVREILPLAFDGAMNGKVFEPEYIKAHCYLANASRTFRIDRVHELADAKTGEVFSTIDWLTSLPMSGQPSAIGSEAYAEPIATPVTRRASLRWKLLISILLAGYLIGRFRLIRWGLHMAGKKWGLWL